MRCYLIRDTHVTVVTALPAKVSDDAVVIESIKSLDARRFPIPRLIEIWNALPGVSPVKRFTDRPAAIKRLWAALEALPISSSRTDSKQAKLIGLLQRPEGASMEDLMETTGWQRHSIRGLLSGVLRKKLGLDVSFMADGNSRIYRIGQ